MNSRLIAGLFVPLYMSQFFGIGFLFTALVAIARDRGGSLELLGVVYVFGLVWAVKFLWAPLVDRFGSRRLGHYRSWLLVTQPATALAILAIAPFDVVDNLGLIIAALGVVALLSATQDIATDALAVRTLRGRGRDGVNGLQVGANFIGDIIGGGAVLVVYDLYGWVPAIVGLAVVTALPALFVARFREPAHDLVSVPDRRVRRASFRSLLRQPGMPRWLFVVTPLVALGMPGAYGMLTPIMVDSGVSVGMVGLITNGLGGVIGIAAAIGAGLALRPLGRKRALVLFAVGQAVAIASVLPAAGGAGPAWAIVAVVLVNVFNSAVFVAMYAINMDRARPTHAGSDFTVQVSVSYFLRFAMAGVAVGIAGAAGYSTAVLVCLGLAAIGVLAAAFLYRDGETAARPERAEPTDETLPSAA